MKSKIESQTIMNTIEAVQTYVIVKAHDFLDESRIENSTMVVDHLQVRI